jgi:hypothetical protein
MRRSSRARRVPSEPTRYIPDRIAGGNNIYLERNAAPLGGDPRVFRHPENGGYLAKRSVALEYVTKLRGGPLVACCARAPYCEHFRGEM